MIKVKVFVPVLVGLFLSLNANASSCLQRYLQNSSAPVARVMSCLMQLTLIFALPIATVPAIVGVGIIADDYIDQWAEKVCKPYFLIEYLARYPEAQVAVLINQARLRQGNLLQKFASEMTEAIRFLPYNIPAIGEEEMFNLSADFLSQTDEMGKICGQKGGQFHLFSREKIFDLFYLQWHKYFHMNGLKHYIERLFNL